MVVSSTDMYHTNHKTSVNTDLTRMPTNILSCVNSHLKLNIAGQYAVSIGERRSNAGPLSRTFAQY